LDLLSVAKSLTLQMNEEQCRKFFKALDKKGKGKIEFEEFCQLLHHPNSLH
jgi:Ca2+-binding EF-hand superfamily protein